MDFRARDRTWRAQLNEVFHESTEGGSDGPTRELQEVITRFKDLLRRRTRIWWNYEFLDKYIQKDLIPRGLRIQVFPSFPVDDEEFRGKWEDLTNTCSRGFMVLLKQMNQKFLDLIENEIDGLQATLHKDMTGDALKKLNDEVDVELRRWAKEIQASKAKKFQRDIQDKQHSRVYRWQNPSGRARTRSRNGFQSRSRSTSTRSNKSTCDEDIVPISQLSGSAILGSGDRRMATRQFNKTQTSSGRVAKVGTQGCLQVLNLSTHTLSEDQLHVLSRGLTFSPTNSFDYFSALKDLHLFSRKLILKKLHSSRDPTVGMSVIEREALRDLEDLVEEQQAPDVSKFPPSTRPRSAKFPPLSLSPAIEVFTKLVGEDFKKLSGRRTFDNLTFRQRQAIQQLKSMKDLVFKQADKGGNVVIWPCVKYEREVFRQLRDSNTYLKLSSNPTAPFLRELQNILVGALDDNVITKQVFDGLLARSPRVPTFYLLPKIHKDALNPPGHPIVSGIDGICNPVCRFIDYYLKPLVETLPSFVKDTTDVLARVDGILVDEGTMFVTADVESLYTCIDHSHGLAAVRRFLGASDLGGPLCELILELVEYILTHNLFVFKDNFNLQKRGTAMGAACAPSYANLFLGAWEREVFGDGGPPLAAHVLCWHRYIDDILFLWGGGSARQLEEFMTSLNVNPFNIRLTYNSSEAAVDFLDIRLEVALDRRIQMDVYRKPTAVNSLLHASSAHYSATIRAVPVGQFLRVRRICSTEARFERQAMDLKDRFMARGYSRRSIKAGYDRARNTPRGDLLHSNAGRGTVGGDERIRFISTYNHEWESMRSIFKKHWPVLQVAPSLCAALGSFPLMTPRRGTNLSNMLVRSHYIPALDKNFFGNGGPRPGCIPCGHCLACANVLRCSDFVSSDGSKTFQIRQHISCGTTNVIYYVTCPCPRIYVGLTTRELRIHIREHVGDIGAARTVSALMDLKTIPRHFRLHHNCNEKLLKVRGIDMLHLDVRGGDNKKRLAQIETKWIVRLDTMTPKGLNESLSFTPYL
ncbi:unnamed protein product [Ranitomeya imitator]|uniref:Helix-turn-helix domain-containing protein n=1 Tax=Ranitomeya imitator TaxID=111125 RepID=A0ABN9LBX8_9NEOB|nr:unnamed protein product [Ranitomeya imitator]